MRCNFRNAGKSRHRFRGQSRHIVREQPELGHSIFAATAFGRIAVPILPESSENEIRNILEHSEAKAIFVSQRLLPGIKGLKGLTAIDIDTFTILNEPGVETDRRSRRKKPLPDDVAAIIYTSGTTGNAKGVMLSHRNFCRNILAAYAAHPCYEKDVWLSVLPMAHTYELSLGLLYPFACGACINYLGKTPTPSLLMSALRAVRPTVMLSVPLIIEKIYRGIIVPSVMKNRALSWIQSRIPALFYLPG